jgi:hypothetical protein
MVFEFLTHEANAPYFFGLSFLTILFAFEVLGLLIGMSLSHSFDSLIDFDVDTDIGGHLSLLGLGKVPLIIWLTFFFGLFSTLGYAANAISNSIIGFIPIWLSIAPVAIVSFIINGALCKVFAKAFPRFETTAVSTDTFSGRVAKITIGNAINGTVLSTENSLLAIIVMFVKKTNGIAQVSTTRSLWVAEAV